MGIAESAGKECYLPLLHPLKQQRLYFAKYKRGDPLSINRYGIQEPLLRGAKIVPPFAIDLIIKYGVEELELKREDVGYFTFDDIIRLQKNYTYLLKNLL